MDALEGDRHGKAEREVVVLEQRHEDELFSLFTLAWDFWWRRNQMVHEQESLEVNQVIDYAFSAQKSFSELKQVPQSMVRAFYEWKPPPSNWLKLNVDGAVFDEINKAGVGLVLRDGKGNVMLAASKIEYEVSDAQAIELLAIFRALQLCANMGIQRLLLESDCLMAVQVLNIDLESAALLDPLVHEIRKLQGLYAE
ncbi:uncharacterized protein LOC121236684 [Juglans microcarpa x Juglans regia]|uniref:uncharacterized protein LOC121236684 n=1 Tax=Juglans microcarpa x Juglans regia TaxID=2249226 RepID=UPI001B7E5750|nr:uncharacterized protein LOC121236684 [Juglans microcarpa x Juglans regia]